ncbi:MAG: hypothetical protein U7126_19860 [Microcoleus sp.]
MQSLGLDAHQPNNLDHSHNNLHLNDHNLNHPATSDITHSD